MPKLASFQFRTRRGWACLGTVFGAGLLLGAAIPLPPLTGLPWIVALPEHGKVQDRVTLPLGATERRPIVVAVHGAGDRPDWACGGWRLGVESYAFVVCPMGLPMGHDRYGWGNTQSIAAATERALAQVKTRFASYLDDGPMIYAGFSQGAMLADKFLVEHAAQFPVAVLAEGGYEFLKGAAFARKYHDAGGRRLMILCGTAGCMATAKRAKVTAEREGLEVIVSGDPTAGHNLNKPMQDAIQRDWQKLVAGLAGWASYSAHRWTH